MKVIIDIPERILDTIQADEMISREQLAVLQMRILNGTPLPKRHGRLIDADKLKTHFIGTEQGTDLEVYLEPTIIYAPTIIEADNAENKEYGVKVINRGNCMLCGKKLTEGLLFCKECEAKGRKER